jgi:hypothetical protein
MVRRRSTVRFRNGAPQLNRIIRKDVRRLWTSRVGPNGYRKGAFTAQPACSREMLSAGPGMPGGPISAGPLRNQGNGAPDGPHRQRHSQNGTAADRLSLDGLPKMAADGQPTASWHPTADCRAPADIRRRLSRSALAWSSGVDGSAGSARRGYAGESIGRPAAAAAPSSRLS